MFHPDILAALAKERRNAMLAEAAAARLTGRARETRRHHRVLVRRQPNPLEYFTRIGPWLAALPSASGPHGPATVAAREKGSKA
jgi:hypothetical protein